eukprot:g3548.t1
MLYKDASNPFIQEFQVEGRLQYQGAYYDGDDVAGGSMNGRFGEFRRARAGVKAKFLQYFGAKYQVNLVSDDRPSGGDLDWGYQDIDEAYLSFDLGKAIGGDIFEELNLIYGRQKFVIGNESHTSSTKLLTVERSAIANKIYGSYRPTGATVEGVIGQISFANSLYSSSVDGDGGEFNSWQDSVVYLGNISYAVNDELTLSADYTYNFADVTDNEDSIIDYAWATAFGAQYDAGVYGVNADFIYGDNGAARLGNGNTRDGEFWGVVLTPYYWIWEDKLQLVGQYQYQGSDSSEGVRVNSRYATRAETGAGINSGRGDSHHSLYAGLNYYVCGHNAKVQSGIEYQTMDTPAGDFDSVTYLLAFRSYF